MSVCILLAAIRASLVWLDHARRADEDLEYTARLFASAQKETI